MEAWTGTGFRSTTQLRGETSVENGNTLVMDGYAGYASLPSYYQADEKFAYDPNRGIHFRTKVRVGAAFLMQRMPQRPLVGCCGIFYA